MGKTGGFEDAGNQTALLRAATMRPRRSGMFPIVSAKNFVGFSVCWAWKFFPMMLRQRVKECDFVSGLISLQKLYLLRLPGQQQGTWNHYLYA